MKELRKVIIKTLIAVWALAGGSLSIILTGYVTDVPLAKYVFTLLENLDGRGLECCFLALGIGAVFYLVRDRQRSPWVSALSAVFSVCTVFGISYAKTASWDCIFLFGNQFLLAVFVMLGYYFLYKNAILFIGLVFETKKEWLCAEAQSRLGRILFEEHSFLGPLLFLLATGLPWLIAFCPGTLQWDAHGQLWMAMGVTEQTSYHPVFISDYMAGCVLLGRRLFHSDSVGLFFYTFPQFLAQSLVFSYVLTVMKRLESPVLFRWMALLFWGVFPYFQIWGFTMVKDSPYYISFVLLAAVLAEVLASERMQRMQETPDEGSRPRGRVSWRQYVLMALAAGGMALSRNDGRYVVVLTLLAAVLCYRRYWKLFALGLCVCVGLLVVEEGIYMPLAGIGKGPAGEMMSVPLQQTARYLREHFDEVTEDEAAVLEAGFEVELSAIADRYKPEISDPVKANFTDAPDKAYLQEYFRVWAAQLGKHPDTYIQAFLNQIYGYFYPACPNHGDYLTVTYIGNSEHWQDGHLDMEFTVKNGVLREFLRHMIYTVERMPVLSLFYGCGVYTWLLLGAATGLLVRKKRRELCVLVPEFSVLLICLVSPVNGYLRYMMPVMAALPLWSAWWFYQTAEPGRIDTDENGMDENDRNEDDGKENDGNKR